MAKAAWESQGPGPVALPEGLLLRGATTSPCPFSTSQHWEGVPTREGGVLLEISVTRKIMAQRPLCPAFLMVCIERTECFGSYPLPSSGLRVEFSHSASGSLHPSGTPTLALMPGARAHLLQDLADGFVLIHLLPRQNLLEPLIHFGHAARKTANSFTLSTFSEHLLCARHLGGDQDKPFIHSFNTTSGAPLGPGGHVPGWVQTRSLSESHGPERKVTEPVSRDPEK